MAHCISRSAHSNYDALVGEASRLSQKFEKMIAAKSAQNPKIQLAPLFLYRRHCYRRANTKILKHASKKKTSQCCVACFFRLSGSIGICNCKSLAVVNTDHPVCHHIICPGDGHNMNLHKGGNTDHNIKNPSALCRKVFFKQLLQKNNN